LLGCPELASDARFSSNALRVKNRGALHALLLPAFGKQSADRLMQRFIEKDVPAGVVSPLSEVFKNPAARSLVLSHPGKPGVKSVKSSVFRLS